MEINEKIETVKVKLVSLGPEIPNNSEDKIKLIFNKLSVLTQKLKSELLCQFEVNQMNRITISNIRKEFKHSILNKLNQRFETFLEYEAEENFMVSKCYQDKEMLRALSKYEGDSIGGFLSIDAFLSLIHPKLLELREPSIDLIEDIV